MVAIPLGDRGRKILLIQCKHSKKVPEVPIYTVLKYPDIKQLVSLALDKSIANSVEYVVFYKRKRSSAIQQFVWRNGEWLIKNFI